MPGTRRGGRALGPVDYFAQPVHRIATPLGLLWDMALLRQYGSQTVWLTVSFAEIRVSNFSLRPKSETRGPIYKISYDNLATILR